MKVLVVGCAVLIAACGDKPSTTEPAPSGTASVAAPVGSIAPVASAAPSASAPGTTASAAHWEGTFTAKRAVLANLPKDVKVPAWDKDPGTASVGPGTLAAMSIASGSVTGTGKGSLGDLIVTGELDQDELRLIVRPTEANAANAMTGVLTAKIAGAAATGAIHVSSKDGNLVREADVKLTKK